MAERPPIRGARVAAGLSLRQLAARVEIDHVALGELERGVRPMTLEERARIYEVICAVADAKQTRAAVDRQARLLARTGDRADASFECVCKQLGQPRPGEGCHRVGLCQMEGVWG